MAVSQLGPVIKKKKKRKAGDLGDRFLKEIQGRLPGGKLPGGAEFLRTLKERHERVAQESEKAEAMLKRARSFLQDERIAKVGEVEVKIAPQPEKMLGAGGVYLEELREKRGKKRQIELAKRKRMLEEGLVDYKKELNREAQRAYNTISMIIDLGNKELVGEMSKMMKDIASIRSIKEVSKKDVLRLRSYNIEFENIFKKLENGEMPSLKKEREKRVKEALTSGEEKRKLRNEFNSKVEEVDANMEKLFDSDRKYAKEYGKYPTYLNKTQRDIDKRSRAPSMDEMKTINFLIKKTRKDLAGEEKKKK